MSTKVIGLRNSLKTAKARLAEAESLVAQERERVLRAKYVLACAIAEDLGWKG
jgi:hypothetical protein